MSSAMRKTDGGKGDAIRGTDMTSFREKYDTIDWGRENQPCCKACGTKMVKTANGLICPKC